MLTELRYQVKIHTISNNPRRKSPANSPQNTLFFLIIKKTKKNMQYGNDIKSKGKITPVTAQRCQYRKTVARPAFSVFPNRYLQSSLKRNRGHNKRVPRLHNKHINIT